MNLSRQQMSLLPCLFLPQTPPDHHLRIPPGQVFWCPRVKSPLALHNLFSCQLFRNSCRGNAVSSLSFFSVYKRKNLLPTRCVRKKLVANLPTSCNNAIQGCHSFVERQDDNKLLEQLVTCLLSSTGNCWSWQLLNKLEASIANTSCWNKFLPRRWCNCRMSIFFSRISHEYGRLCFQNGDENVSRGFKRRRIIHTYGEF
jgi:hypothetical protein